MARMTRVVEHNVGPDGGTYVSEIRERQPTKRNPEVCSYLHGFEPGPYPRLPDAIIITRPEQYPLWKVMLAPGMCGTYSVMTKRERIAIYAAYWERCGAQVEWPRKMRRYRAFARTQAEKIYARATCRADMMTHKAEQTNPLTGEG